MHHAVYISAPYTNGDIEANVNAAIEAGNRITGAGHQVFIPHLTHFWHLRYPHEYEFWMEHDLFWLEKCTDLVRLPGESQGADREVKRARESGIVVHSSVDGFLAYAEMSIRRASITCDPATKHRSLLDMFMRKARLILVCLKLLLGDLKGGIDDMRKARKYLDKAMSCSRLVRKFPDYFSHRD